VGDVVDFGVVLVVVVVVGLQDDDVEHWDVALCTVML